MNVIVFAGDTYDLKLFNKTSIPRIRQCILHEIEIFKDFLVKSRLINKSKFIQGNHDHTTTHRMYVKLATRAGWVVILHGHNLGAENIAKRSNWGGGTGEHVKKNLVKGCELEWVPQLRPEDWLVMGHSHVSYFRTEKRVVGLGCWFGRYSNPSVGTYLLIDDRSDNKPSILKNLLTLKRYNGISHKDVFTTRKTMILTHNSNQR